MGRFGLHVIPAKAGIQFVSGTFAKVCGVNSRFRGNELSVEKVCERVYFPIIPGSQ